MCYPSGDRRKCFEGLPEYAEKLEVGSPGDWPSRDTERLIVEKYENDIELTLS